MAEGKHKQACCSANYRVARLCRAGECYQLNACAPKCTARGTTCRDRFLGGKSVFHESFLRDWFFFGNSRWDCAGKSRRQRNAEQRTSRECGNWSAAGRGKTSDAATRRENFQRV